VCASTKSKQDRGRKLWNFCRRLTQAIVDVAKSLAIAAHDHIIVGKDGNASLKGLRLI